MAIRGPSVIRVCILAAALALGACAGAVMDDFDPAQIRIITPTEATSTCIGDPSTPLCAVETVIGCTQHVWNKGCPLVRYDFRPNPPKTVRIEYVIVKSGLVNKEKIEEKVARIMKLEPSYFGPYPWLTGEAFQARYRERVCPSERESCAGFPWLDAMATVSPRSNHWISSQHGLFNPENWFVD